MIISHKHQFIFVKTRKTAGSTLEKLLYPYLGQFDICTGSERDNTPPLNTDNKDGHMGWKQIENFYPREWKEYYKFTIERNPWDKVVSDFFWESRGTNLAADLTTAFEAYVSRSLPWPVEEQVPRLLDPTWTLLRFETLERDFCRLTQALGLGEHRSLLPQFKSNVRPPGTDYRDVHTAFTRDVVAVIWSDWIQTFDYSFGEKLP